MLESLKAFVTGCIVLTLIPVAIVLDIIQR